MRILLDGKIKELKKTNLDTGFFYGFGLFETIYVRDMEAVFLEDHLDRLNKGLVELAINRKVEKEAVFQAIGALGLKHGGLKINVSESHVVFSTRSIGYTREDYEAGAALTVSEIMRNPTSPLVSLKSMNYADNLLGMKAAKQKGFSDAIYLNPHGRVCETSVANIFIIEGETLITPPVMDGLLPGIVRKYLLNETTCVEESISLERLLKADGVFITNSLMGIMKVRRIDDHELAASLLTDRLTANYVAYIKEVCQ